jgi:small multidrug resistance pump
MAFLYLTVAVIAEVLATAALKASNGFTELVPIIFTVLGYTIALFFLGLTFKTIPMGLAYAMWSAADIVLISCVGWIVFRQNLDLPALIGLVFIVLGIVIINIFSESTEL